MAGFVLAVIARMARALVAVAVFVSVWIGIAWPVVIFAVIPLPIPLPLSVAMTVSGPVALPVALAGSVAPVVRMAVVVVVPVFPVAPCFFFLGGALPLGLLGGQRLLEIIEAVHRRSRRRAGTHLEQRDAKTQLAVDEIGGVTSLEECDVGRAPSCSDGPLNRSH
jgi:hypothetical protein